MKHRSLLLTAALLCTVAACGSPSSTESPTVMPTAAHSVSAAPTAAPPAKPTEPTFPAAPPTVTPQEPMTAEQLATITAALQSTPTPKVGEGFFAGISGDAVQALEVAEGGQALWAVFSQGERGVDTSKRHFIAIYTRKDGSWQELGRVELELFDYFGFMGLRQVKVDPIHIWLEARGRVIGGNDCLYLLRFDGQMLHNEVSACSPNPAVGVLTDLNYDRTPDVLLDATIYDVVCYTCQWSQLRNYKVLRWDGQKMVEVALTPLPDSAPAELRTPINQAVALAQAGFWKDARDAVSQVEVFGIPEEEATWNTILIRLVAEAREARGGAYPLLDNLYYGDYAAALETMRPYQPAELFGADTPLLKGTVAQGRRPQVAREITQTVEVALTLKPDLAAAYFLRGWAVHLTDPRNPSVLADIARAAQLDPKEMLFSDSLAYLRKK
jgi:hypothetical protein